MSTQYPILDNRPINKWKVAELKEELKRRKLTTRGLKDDLVKRLDEAICKEREAFEEEASKGFECDLESMVKCEDAGAKLNYDESTEDTKNHDENKTGTVDDAAAVGDIDDGPTDLGQGKDQEEETTGGDDIDDGPTDRGQGKYQEEETMGVDDVAAVGDIDDGPTDLGQGKDQEEETAGGADTDEAVSVDDIAAVGDIDDGSSDLDQGKVQEEETTGGTDTAEVVGESAVLEASVETNTTVNESVVTQIASSEEALEDNKIELENEDSKPPQMDAVLDMSNPNNQVHEVSPVLGFQVNSESIYTDSVSFNEKNELRYNLNSDNVNLELDVVKLEMVQPLSSGDPPSGGDLHSLYDQKPRENQGFVEETVDNESTHDDFSKENDSADGESSVKLNRYSADDSTKEDVLENKQTDSNHNSNEVGDKIDITEVPAIKDECPIVAVGPDLSPEEMETSEEKNTIAAYTEERKLEDEHKSTHMDFGIKSDMADGGFVEKLNLDHSPADDCMEEDALETKQIDSNHNSSEVGHEIELIEVCGSKVEGTVDTVVPDYLSIKMENAFEKKDSDAAPSEKRKFQDGVGIDEPPKRQRRWNSESLKIPEPQSSNIKPTTPKDSHHTTRVGPDFNRSDSSLSGEEPKERVVPPSPKPPTNSLRIDRFLRPFTLKAVQELLSKTGNVCSFWMDLFKTHCYVMYSSVEEAIETRNAVYNLQWPPNGGRLLVVEFVDPQEVKLRVEARPQSPAAPVSTTPTVPVAPTPIQSPPTARQHGLRQQLPPPPPLEQPPPTSDPPMRRERHPRSPPQPAPENVDPPIVTLDDLFRKTRATPRIYYLPLTEEQVAAKLAVRDKTSKQ